MFLRERHRTIAQILSLMDAQLLAESKTYFGGGTAISLRHGEFRQSDDIDFMVSDDSSFRELRALVRRSGPRALFKDQEFLVLPKTFLSDQYGIRGWVELGGSRIKFEIVHEGRIELATPSDNERISGVLALTDIDLIAEKIMANSDRFLDTSVFHRDIIDLAFMSISGFRSSEGFLKAFDEYGDRGIADLDRSIQKLLSDFAWLDTCLRALQITTPRAVVVKYLMLLR